MAWPTDAVNPAAEDAARGLNVAIRTMVQTVTAWRAQINSTSLIAASDAVGNYQTIAALKQSITTAQAVPGIGAAIIALYAPGNGFVLATEATNVKAQIDAFVTAFQGFWPKVTTGPATGSPSFNAYDIVTKQLISFNVTLDAATKTTVLARLDALLAAFV